MAPQLIAFADVGEGEKILDVGCGAGSLTFALAETASPVAVVGVDASEIYVAAARERNADPRISILDGDACDLPFEDGAFDRVLSQLALQFVSDPRTAAAEMRRMARPGGGVAAAVWNTSGGMAHQRMFSDLAAMLDPAGAAARSKMYHRPMTGRGELKALWEAVGLVDVEEGTLTVEMDFAGFADFWGPIVSGEGTLGRYVDDLGPDGRAGLERHVRDAYESGRGDGPRLFHSVAWACRGTVPA